MHFVSGNSIFYFDNKSRRYVKVENEVKIIQGSVVCFFVLLAVVLGVFVPSGGQGIDEVISAEGTVSLKMTLVRVEITNGGAEQ